MAAPDVLDAKEQFASLTPLLFRGSEEYAPPNFEPGQAVFDDVLEYFRVLVVGAGGLGCELLKSLALSGFRNIEVIDMDTIELSNLNRQFLFREKDIGQPKSETAARFVMERVPGCNIIAHNKPIQEFDSQFYRRFHLVIAGLDNLKARRWLNAKLVSLVNFDENGVPDINTLIPLIDGGTEGFKGHVRLILPGLSSCFECSMGAMPPQQAFAICTLQGKPRKPEHCVAYAHKLLWPKLKRLDGLGEGEWELAATKEEAGDGVDLDKDDPIHMTWLYQRALERAEEFGIEGVDYTMTMQVVKNIIPAIASTNALISSACVVEAFKVLTWCSWGLNNWFMYMGQNGLYSNTYEFAKVPTCPVSGDPIPVNLDPSCTLNTLRQKIMHDLQLSDPSLLAPELKANGFNMYSSNKFLRKATEANLEKTLGELLEGQAGTQALVYVTDANLAGSQAKFNLTLVEGEFWAPPEDDE